MQELEQFEPPFIFGPEKIVIDKEIHDIHDMISAYRARLNEGEIIKEAKLQVVINGEVNFIHVQKYLERYKDYRVHSIFFHSGNFRSRNRTRTMDTPFGRIKYKETRYITDLKHVIEKLVEKSKPELSQLFHFLAEVQVLRETWLLDDKFERVRLFDMIRGMLLVKIHDRKVNGRYSHAINFGCKGDCQPMLNFAESEDYEGFVNFFRSKGYTVKVSLCVVLDRPKIKTDYIKTRIPGYERQEICAVL